MKTRFLISLAMVLLLAFPVWAGTGTVIVVVPHTSTYTAKVENGITVYQRSDSSKFGTSMGFSGVSVCQVLDLSKMDLSGYFTFQMKSLTGSTSYQPVSGTTLTFAWKGSNVDSPEAWAQATRNVIFSGINALTGATMIVYDMNSITGVTPFRFVRPEFESGVSAETTGAGNLIPVGTIIAR